MTGTELPRLPSGSDPETFTLTHDEVLVLFELFERLEEQDAIRFEHPAEWTALGALTAKLVHAAWEPFSPDYRRLLAEAQKRLGAGFEGHVTGLGNVRVQEDGTFTSVPKPDRDVI